jgi:glutathione peroxidase
MALISTSPRFGETPMKTVLCVSLVLAIALVLVWNNFLRAEVIVAENPAATAATPLDKDMTTLDGKDVNLAQKYDGKVVLLVNVASRCGLTPQYEALQALHEKYADQGLAIVGVPSNQFNGQEPGSAAEIAEFCEKNYGVEFDLMAKTDVNGPNAAPLYKDLTSKEKNGELGGKITWNFEKFLFNRQGQPVARFTPRVKPDAPEVVQLIEAELAK